jgi:hypothetical protein
MAFFVFLKKPRLSGRGISDKTSNRPQKEILQRCLNEE